MTKAAVCILCISCLPEQCSILQRAEETGRDGAPCSVLVPISPRFLVCLGLHSAMLFLSFLGNLTLAARNPSPRELPQDHGSPGHQVRVAGQRPALTCPRPHPDAVSSPAADHMVVLSRKHCPSSFQAPAMRVTHKAVSWAVTVRHS